MKILLVGLIKHNSADFCQNIVVILYCFLVSIQQGECGVSITLFGKLKHKIQKKGLKSPFPRFNPTKHSSTQNESNG